MNLNVLKKYVTLCDVFSIKPSWKGLNEYYIHNRAINKFSRKKICFTHFTDYRVYKN